MKLPIRSDIDNLCEECVGLCCRYYALNIETPTKKRDFEDIRWYMLHGDSIIFVEDGEWFIQINHKCNALMADNRCSIYENRPAICREYSTRDCDCLANEYGYDNLFTEPAQIEQYAKEFLAKQRKLRAAARKKADSKTNTQRKSTSKAVTSKRNKAKPGKAKISRIPVRILKSA